MTREINLGNLIIPLIKPQKGIDYYTSAEKQEIVNEVTNNVNDVILPQEEIRQSNEITRQNNENTRQAQETSRTISENERQNAETERIEAESIRQDNESSRESAEQERTETFNTQMQAVNTAIQGIHTSQEAYDQNAQEKTTAFNTNATNKMNAYNTNATEKIAEYDAHVHDYEQELANKVDKQLKTGSESEYKVLSDNNFADNYKAKLEGDYTKPTGGIPKTDLSSDVQTSLGKADTAIQEHQDITGKEDKSNKVTELTSSSTDTQYPSAKAVYDADQENYKVINKLQEKLETQQEIINQMPQVEDEGYDATLNDTIKAPFTKFDIEGHSEQETTEGYNLLDWTGSGTSTANGVTRNFETPTKIKFSGTPTGAQVAVYGVPLPTLEANTDYTLVCKGINGSGLYYNLGFVGDSTANVKVFNSGTNLTRYLEIHAQSTSAVNVTIEFMLLKGSYTASNVPSYEPYTNGASPNPSYEQPIKSAGENVNLFDGELELGSISTSTGNAVASNNSIRTKNFQSVKENTDYSLSNDKGYQSVVILYDENQNFISSLGSKTQFTTTATTKYIKWRSSEVNQETDLSVKYKLEPGSTATPYSPFGMGSITDKIVNKNLAYVEAEGKFRNYTNGNFVTNADYNSYIAEVEENTDYMVKSFNNIDFSNLCFFDQNMKYISGLGFNGSTNRQFTTVENCKYATIAVKNTENQFMITKGTTIPTDYVAHEEQTYSIYTQQPFRSIGNVRDVFFKNTVDSPYYDENLVENGWYERHLPRLVLDGTENWTKISTRFFIELDDITLNGVTKTLCNYFKKSENWVDHSNTNNSIIIFKDNAWNKARLSINSDKFETINEFNAWLSSENVYIDYLSQDPLNLLCTTEQTNILENIPSTFAGQTNVFSEDEVKAYLRAKGLKDLNKMFSDITNAITAQGANV